MAHARGRTKVGKAKTKTNCEGECGSTPCAIQSPKSVNDHFEGIKQRTIQDMANVKCDLERYVDALGELIDELEMSKSAAKQDIIRRNDRDMKSEVLDYDE